MAQSASETPTPPDPQTEPAAEHDRSASSLKKQRSMRTCIVTGREGSRETLLRFARSPDGHVVPDLAGKLPGRGVWTVAERGAVIKAAKKGLFARGFKAATKLPDGMEPDGFADDIDAGLQKRLLGALGLARRGGSAIVGGEAILKAFERRKTRESGAPAVVFIAPETSDRGARAVRTAADAAEAVICSNLNETALSSAVGLMGVKMIAVGPPADGLKTDIHRLTAFRGAVPEALPEAFTAAGSSAPARSDKVGNDEINCE
ncbi:MAG: DUF448 domain-containing protein [Pseudomonadota bacterium]